MLRRIYLLTIVGLIGSTLTSCAQQTRQARPPESVATATFVGKGGQQTSGTYRIERDEDGLRLVLAPDFRTDEGPDLHVVLSPTPAGAVISEHALADGEALVVAQLASRTGPQTFELPDSVDLTAYRSVLIHCIRYAHLYGAAPLER